MSKRKVHSLFPTLVYQSPLTARPSGAFHRELLKECVWLRENDGAGVKWSRANYKNGYTSYGSVTDLHRRFPHFEELRGRLDVHVKKYARALHWNLQGGRLEMTDCWVNMMEENTAHSLHLHPHAVVSGTYYVQVPKGSGAIKFEDPRLSKMMAAPSRKADAPAAFSPFARLQPQAGQVLLFESWLRHEVEVSRAKGTRVSVSFNYNWV